MEYKTKPIPGAPDWVPERIVVDAWREGGPKMRGVYFSTLGSGKHVVRLDAGYYDATFDHVEPVEAWVPEVGEVVAAWDDDDTPVRLLPYIGHFNDVKGRFTHRAGHTIYKNIARIPDDMLAKGFPCEASWWEANGEKYEVGDE